MAKGRRWTCGECGKYKIAPSRLATSDIRRFCIECSVSTGHLVERIVLSHESKKRQKAAARKAARVASAEKQKAKELAQYTVLGIDTRDLVKTFLRLPAMKVQGYGGIFSGSTRKRIMKFPDFTVRRSKTKSYTTGRAWPYQNRFVITVGTACDIATLQEVILHELCHLVAGPDHGHDQHFNHILTRASFQAWEIELEGPWKGYARSWDLVAKLREYVSKYPLLKK